MSERLVRVVPEAGLHARPASEFVQTANEHDCEIRVAAVDSGGNEEDEPVDASSMLGVTSLGVGHDERVKLIAEGEESEDALDALEEVLSTPENGDSGECDGDSESEGNTSKANGEEG